MKGFKSNKLTLLFTTDGEQGFELLVKFVCLFVFLFYF